VKLVNFRVEDTLFERFAKVTSKMRYGQRNRILRQLLEVFVDQMEGGRRVRLVDIRVKKHIVAGD